MANVLKHNINDNIKELMHGVWPTLVSAMSVE